MASVTCGLTAQDRDQLWKPYARFEYRNTINHNSSGEAGRAYAMLTVCLIVRLFVFVYISL